MTTTVADAVARMTGEHTRDDDLIVGVQVPATSANLGPGYDALGVALDVPFAAVAGARAEQRVISTGFGGDELPGGDDNLVWRALVAWCDHVGATPPDVSITVRSAIPLERGMGSSSAACVAGLVLGRALVGDGAGTSGVRGGAALLALATEIEGHPDNAAPAIMGGLTLCLPGGVVRRVTPDPALRPVLLIPSQRQSTDAARGILPSALPLRAAAENAARAMAVFAGLGGLIPLGVEAMADVLHEPPRMQVMADTGHLVRALREAGIPACISGAGPAALAVVPAHDDATLRRVGAIVDEVASSTQDFEVLPTAWDLSGARLCPPVVAG